VGFRYRTHFITYSEVLKNLGKCSGEIEPRMRLGDLNNIEQHRYRDAFLLEMDGDCHIGFVIR